ncbi:MAG: hypothetical protein P4N59_32510 [Negativicutes bacterium]|nr:hypothetical protein [Negativicutes bacterium]
MLTKETVTGQVVVSVRVAKQLIARAIYHLPEVQQALRQGKIVLKAGTTVAPLAELLGAPPLRIGGRITPDGARNAKMLAEAPHIVVIEDGQWRAADRSLPEDMAGMGPGDVFITGANALDASGVAGLMAGMPGGSVAGKALSNLASEGINTIIAVGLEKLIPGAIIDICRLAGRKKIDKSMGMAVGLMPLFGKVVTEQLALELMTGVTATVIGAGGINGAEGATTMLVTGTDSQVQDAFALIAGLRAAPGCGHSDSLVSCETYGYSCGHHLACIYKQGMPQEG